MLCSSQLSSAELWLEKWLRVTTKGPLKPFSSRRQKINKLVYNTRCIHLITVVVVYNYVCECTVGVDVRDGTPILLNSILPIVVMGCMCVMVPLLQQHNVNLWRMVVLGCTVLVQIQKQD